MTTKTKAPTVTVDAKVLRDAMRSMANVVERRNTIPLLSHVVLRTGPSTMTIIATDLDVELRQQIDLADSGTNGSFSVCVGADALTNIARKVPAGSQVALTAEDGRLRVVAGRSRFDLPTLPVDDFPKITFGDCDAQFEMDKAQLIDLFDSTGFAQSTDETRYYMNGVYCHFDDAKLIGAATDGHRLARFKCDAPDGAEVMPGVILGRKTVKIIDDLLEDAEGAAVEVALSRTKIRFTMGAIDLTAKLIDGTFPDYSRVIPTGNTKALWIDPKALVEAIDRVTTIATDNTRSVVFDMARDVLTLRVTSPENGAATEEIPCQYDAEPLTLRLNGQYAISVARRLNSDMAQVLFDTPSSPILWRDSESAHRLFVLMPMRL